MKCKFETILINFHILLQEDLLVSLVLWMNLLPMPGFEASFIIHLENIDLLSYTGLPHIDPFHFILSRKKNHMFNITIDLTREISQYWEPVKLMVGNTSFLKFWSLIEVQTVSLVTITISLEMTRYSLNSVSRKYLPDPQVRTLTIDLLLALSS